MSILSIGVCLFLVAMGTRPKDPGSEIRSGHIGVLGPVLGPRTCGTGRMTGTCQVLIVLPGGGEKAVTPPSPSLPATSKPNGAGGGEAHYAVDGAAGSNTATYSPALPTTSEQHAPLKGGQRVSLQGPLCHSCGVWEPLPISACSQVPIGSSSEVTDLLVKAGWVSPLLPPPSCWQHTWSRFQWVSVHSLRVERCDSICFK